MKVWVVVEEYFNGEGYADLVGPVFSSEEKADAFCKRKNASSYPSIYDYQERELDKEEAYWMEIEE